MKVIEVLVVDDEAKQRSLVCDILSEEGYQVREASGVAEAIELWNESPTDIVLTDLRMPGEGGMELVAYFAKREPRPQMVVITAHASVETAVRAMKLGAYDYLTKPVEPEDLLLTVARAAEKCSLVKETTRLRTEVLQGFGGDIVAVSETMKSLLETARLMAVSDATILIRGESGTGKEKLARRIHYESARRSGPMVSLNCSAFPESLLEAELFGHEKGSFTGAHQRRLGLVESARGGTLFLDEIGDMPLNLQAKVLRLIQEKEVRRIGSSQTQQVDVRIIAATHQDLEKAIADNTFREDLFYRLNILPLVLPPLRERRKDIPLLATHFLKRFAPGKSLDSDAIAALEAYTWPGNIRELEAVIQRLSILVPGPGITASDLPPELRLSPADRESLIVLSRLPENQARFSDMEKQLLHEALEKADGNMTEAARSIGMSYRAFRYRCIKFDLLPK